MDGKCVTIPQTSYIRIFGLLHLFLLLYYILKGLCDSPCLLEFHNLNQLSGKSFSIQNHPTPKTSASISLSIPIISCNCAGCLLQCSEVLGTGEIAQSVNLRPHLGTHVKSQAQWYTVLMRERQEQHQRVTLAYTPMYTSVLHTHKYTHSKVLLVNREKETMNIGQTTNRPCYNQLWEI